MLTTLASHGMVEFDEADQLWSVGVETYRMGAAFLRRRKLVDRARVGHAGTDGEAPARPPISASPRTIAWCSSARSRRIRRSAPSSGRARAARSTPRASARRSSRISAPIASTAIVARTGLEAFTDKTLVATPRARRADLAEIRARGWSVDDEERHPGMRCVAAAIFNEFGEPVGGISISGPTVRVTPERLAAIGPEVRDAAAAITKMIGGVSP